MRKYAIIIIMLAISLIFSLPLFSAGKVLITDELNQFRFGKNVEYLEDTSGSLKFGDVKERNTGWVQSKKDNFTLGFTGSAYWLKFTVENRIKPGSCWYLEIDYPLIDDIQVYYPGTNGMYVMKKAGDTFPFYTREVVDRRFFFGINTPEGTSEFYVRLKTTGALNFTPSFISNTALIKRTNSDLPIYGFYYGLIFVMMIYNLFLFISLREKQYLAFSIYLIFFILYDSTLNGLSFQYLWPESTWLANNILPFFMLQCIAWVTLFCSYYVDSPAKNPGVYKFALYAVVVPLFILSFIAFSGNISFSLRISAFFSMYGIIVLFISGPVLFFKKNKENNTVMTAFLALTIGIILFTLKNAGILPPMFLTNWGSQIGIVACIMIFSLSMAHKLNIMKKNLITLNFELKEKEKHAVDRAVYLEEAVSGMKNISIELHEVSGELSVIGGSFENLSAEQSSTSEEMSASFEELTSSNNMIFESTVRQTNEGKRTRELVDILENSQKNVYRVSQKVVEGMSVITESANDTEGNLTLMVDMMEHIDKGGKAIEGITGLIDDITDRINLLSLNAAIEAARAGNAGRGFSVVADEIGKLASATSENSKEISTQIKRMITDIISGKTIVEKTKVSIEIIFSKINDINKSIEETKKVLTDQSTALDEVKNQADLMEGMAENISGATREHNLSMEENIKTVIRLSEIAEEIASSTKVILGFTRSISEKSGNLEGLIKNITN